MPRRSRHRSGVRKPAIIAIVLIVLLSGWFWQQQRARHAAVGEARPEAAETVATDGSQSESALPLPPLESTRIGAEGAAANVPAPPPGTAAKPAAADTLPDFLPPEAHQTLRLIARDGPFPHRQDGSVFGNREGRLPSRPRGYYREYTVDTPGLDHRGARRIVTGGRPPVEFYYTDDHYESFRRFDASAAQVNR